MIVRICFRVNRLKKESLWFKIDKRNIAELSNLNLDNLAAWFDGIELRLSDKQNAIAKDVLKEIRERLQFLLDVGLTYLSLNRPSKSLRKLYGPYQRVERYFKQKFIAKFRKDCIKGLLADREFIGNDWVKWLKDEHISFVIRRRNNLFSNKLLNKPNGVFFITNRAAQEIFLIQTYLMKFLKKQYLTLLELKLPMVVLLVEMKVVSLFAQHD